MAAIQAARTFQAIAAYAGNRKSARSAEQRGVREMPSGAAAPAPSSSVGAEEVAQQLFALAPYKILLRTMLFPKHMMPLGSISKAFDNNFGEHVALLGKLARHVIGAWSGSAFDLISDLTKLMLIVTASDVQYGLALGGLSLLIVTDLLGNKP